MLNRVLGKNILDKLGGFIFLISVLCIDIFRTKEFSNFKQIA